MENNDEFILQIKKIVQRAADASIKGKTNSDKSEELPPYIDDYEGISEEERLKIWDKLNDDTIMNRKDV